MTKSSDADSDMNDELSGSSYRPGVSVKQFRDPLAPMMAPAVQELKTSLKDTERNINAVDGLLGYFRNSNDRQNATIERLRENLARSTDSLKQERCNTLSFLNATSGRNSQPLKTSDLLETRGTRKYKPASCRDHFATIQWSKRSKGRQPRKPSVRFHEHSDEINDFQEAVQDLSNDQIRLEDDLDQEIKERTQEQIKTRESLQQLKETLQQSKRNFETMKSSDRVDKRLQAIQEELKHNRMHQEKTERRNKESVAHSAEQKHKEGEERDLRERLLKAEADKQQLVLQLESTQRKLDRTHGVKSAIQDQMKDYKLRLKLSDQERSAIQDKLSDLQATIEHEGLPYRLSNGQNKLQESEMKEKHDRQLEHEIETLRVQLNQSQAMKNLEKYQQQLHHSEHLRNQLSQHLEDATKEVQNKEMHVSKLLAQQRSTQESLKSTHKHHELLLTQLKDMKTRLEDRDRNAEKQIARQQELNHMLDQAELKKDNMRSKAKEKIRQWKVKCAKLEREGESLKHRLAQTVNTNQQVLKDGSHTQNIPASHHVDSLQREINDILEKRAQQDEQLRLKDVEINELKSVRKDLEQELRDTRNFMDKLDNELQAHQVRHRVVLDEKTRLQEETSLLKCQNQQTEDHIKKLQGEWNKLNAEHSEVSGQLAQESGYRRVAEAQIRKLIQDFKLAKEDTDRLDQQLKQEKESRKMYIEETQKDYEAKKSKEDKMRMERSNFLNHVRAEMEAELQTLKLEVRDSHLELKALRRQLEESKNDMKQVETELDNTEQDNDKLRHKYAKAKALYQTQVQFAQTENLRACQLERSLGLVAAKLKEQDLVNIEILCSITKEIDQLVESCTGHKDHPAVLSPTRNLKYKPQQLLADIKRKLKWVQKGLTCKCAHPTKIDELEHSLTDPINVTKCKNFMNNLNDGQELLVELQNQGPMTSTQQTDDAVKSLDKQVVQLEHHIDLNVRSLRRSLESGPQLDISLQGSSSKHYSKDLQDEQERINDQYNRYKGTVNLLQQHLADTKRLPKEQP